MSTDANAGRSWDALAPWWKETFTDGADAEYELQILPIIIEELRGARRVLDLGCGEGQVSRRLADADRSSAVVGVDPSFGQLANATRAIETISAAGGAPPQLAYAQAAGERLPFAAASFDAVVCCLAIEHAEDADALLAEVVRVIAPGGRFLLLINHPMYQGEGSGFIDDRILNERYWRVGPYLEEKVSLEEVDRGVFIPFAHRPLSRYINPLGAGDLVLTKMLEPAPLAEFLEQSIAPELERSIPRLLVLRFEQRSPGAPSDAGVPQARAAKRTSARAPNSPPRRRP